MKFFFISIKTTQVSTLNVNFSNSQLNKLKLVICDSNDETNFIQKLLLTVTLVSRLRKVFANYSLPNIKLSKTQLFK